MRYLIIASIVLAVGFNAVYSAEIQEAVTKDGKTVILKPDGTWSFAEAPKPGTPGDLSKSENATKSVQSDKGFYEIWFDPAKWEVKKAGAPPIEFKATHAAGDGYGFIIAERISVNFDTLKNVAVENARKAAPDIKVLSTEYRTVNGVKIMALKMSGTIQNISFVYYGYYWCGKAGTLQAVMYTGENLFDQFSSDFTEFLNGLVITKP
jgi:hypothetical protein